MATTVQSIFTIEHFDPGKANWERWVKRLEGAFKIFKIEKENKVSYLLHYMGPETYDTLCDRLAPEDPTLESYDTLVKSMKGFYSPAPLEIAENFRYHGKKQQEGESAQEFLVALRKMAINCNFGSYLNTALRNQFVFGLRSEKIQDRLLEVKDLTLDKALETAVSMELSAKDTALLHKQAAVGAIQVLDIFQIKYRDCAME